MTEDSESDSVKACLKTQVSEVDLGPLQHPRWSPL